MILRNLIIWIAGSILTIVLFIPVLMVAIFDRTGNGVHSIGRIWARGILFICGIEVEIGGIENLIKDSPQILTSNHQGAFDIPVFQAYLPIQFRWVSKETLFRLPFIGWAMSLAGYVSVDRVDPKKAYKSLNKAEGKLKEGISILIFPEGTRSDREVVKDFKRGAFLLAMRTGLPIIPVSTWGTGKVTGPGFPWIHRARVKVYIDRPLEPSSFKEMGIKELMERTHNIIDRNFERLKAEEVKDCWS